MTRRAALVLSALGLAGTGAAPAPRYGDRLLATVMRRQPAVAGITIDARTPDGTMLSVDRGDTAGAGNAVAMRDATGAIIGRVTVVAKPGGHADAGAIAAWLARRVYVPGNIAEPDPFVPEGRIAPNGQALVDRALDRFPDLVTLALHVAVDGQPNRIVASSFGRIGKPGDADDRQVEQDRAVRREVTDDGRRLAVELPLVDRDGRIIGALSTSFMIPPGQTAESIAPRAIVVRDMLARAIVSRAWLFTISQEADQRRD